MSRYSTGEQEDQAAEPSDIRADCHGDSLRAMKQTAKALFAEHQKKRRLLTGALVNQNSEIAFTAKRNASSQTPA
jgi:hypothetical protein